MAREELLNYLKTLFRGKLQEDCSYIWPSIVCCAVEIGAIELQDDIKNAFENDYIELLTIDLEYANEEILKNNETGLNHLKKNHHYSPIKNTISDMSWWACFTEKKRNIASNKKKIGRNEPCPCGSGKKYKKCCLE